MDSKSNFFILFTESCLTVPHNSTAKFKFYGLSRDRDVIPLKSWSSESRSTALFRCLRTPEGQLKLDREADVRIYYCLLSQWPLTQFVLFF